MFPHMFMHWLTAKGARTFRVPLMVYPLCIAAVWIPSVTLGVVGHLDFPGLQGPAANPILVRLIDLHAPEVLAGLLARGRPGERPGGEGGRPRCVFGTKAGIGRGSL